jgi:hypothetical protein
VIPKTDVRIEGLLWGDSDYEIFGPAPPILGELVGTYLTMRNQPPMHFIYLAPALEDQPKEVVLGIVAHEIAHAMLRHGSPEGQKNMTRVGSSGLGGEQNADSLASKWGFAQEIARSRETGGPKG